MENKTVRVGDICGYLESVAPPAYQESYDNSGLITGTPDMPVSGILVTLDATEEVMDEAIRRKCNLVIAHHPIVFSGIKKLNGKNYVERTVIKAVKNDLAIYAIHTNLDNVSHGVNHKIAEKLGLKNTRILQPKEGLLLKLVTYVPKDHLDSVQQALFSAGAGHIGNYDECSFYSEGTGTFRAGERTDPFVGEKGKRHGEQEMRLETILPAYNRGRVISALLGAHPYEEVAYDLVPLANVHSGVGSGMIGELEKPLAPGDFLKHLKYSMSLDMIRYTEVDKETISKVAVCGGAGSFLLKNALSAGADAFITGDFKYHEFFDAEKKLMIADIGHYESEIFTKELLKDLIMEKFHTFAVLLSEINTNPVKYF